MQYADAGIVLQLDSNNARCILLISCVSLTSTRALARRSARSPASTLASGSLKSAASPCSDSSARHAAIMRAEKLTMPARRLRSDSGCSPRSPWFHVFMDVSHQEAAL